MARAPDVVVVDHHDSYTQNLVHLVAGVTGVLPSVVQHDACTPEQLQAHDVIVLSPGPGHPDEHDWSLLDLGRPGARCLPRDAGHGDVRTAEWSIGCDRRMAWKRS